ncbi:hypothetical protein AVEN_55658-1 [Araneus ventricosus]|uniref:Uncharacterized protein n=1 Tax=Araneus ventricosus TaxID=182803 RepID=A0A4Y2IKQ0_ARAVE|nr:hypothetical protein AVEN_55658-1 [Araneus ventricosus]
MTMIKLEEDRQFLIDQSSERNMIMTTLDKKLAGMQERVSERQKEVQARKERTSADEDAASLTSKILSAEPTPLSSPDRSSSNSEVRIMVPIAAALGEVASSLSISHFTVHKVRKKDRSAFIDVVAKNYARKYPITIHWDSKILPDIMGIEIVDRLPVIVSGDGKKNSLELKKNATEAIYKILEQWDLVNQAIDMSFGTTSVNTIHLSGTCTLLEGKIG